MLDGEGSLTATVYATRGGKFVLTVGEEGGDTLSHYATYSRPHLIAQDEVLRELCDEDENSGMGTVGLPATLREDGD